jgi:nitrate reductase NapD
VTETREALHHISSAVIRTRPEWAADIACRLSALPDTEVRHVENGKIIVILEGPDTDTIGGRLTAIALLDGVLSANLVFEHVEPLQSPEESHDA